MPCALASLLRLCASNRWWIILVLLTLCVSPAVQSASRYPRYYAHETVEDGQGVIAPWYQGQNGQWDARVRIAAETLKRYPWAIPPKSLAAAPEFVWSGAWLISPLGEITIPPLNDWANGDMGQRAAYLLTGLVDYYRYSGDGHAIGLISVTADTLINHSMTSPEHPWPSFLISVPNKGKPYGQSDPNGMIQLDITAEVGLGLLRAYQVTGNGHWLNTALEWGEQLALHRTASTGASPWNRYANPEAVLWNDTMTGGVVFLLEFFEELIRLGCPGTDDCIVKARDAGREYLSGVLLPRWTENDTWGRNYWDWVDDVQAENVTEFTVRYLMDHPDVFPNWRCDARNILSLFLHRTSVSPQSGGDTFSGAWAFPESSSCCGRSLWYGPMELSVPFAQYAALTGEEWAREITRRQITLATYDFHDTGVVEDNIEGGPVVAGDWFKIAHPMALKHVLATMSWLPDLFGPSRENHILRSTAVVNNVSYQAGQVSYTTFDAPAGTIDVLRLSFSPAEVHVDGTPLDLKEVLQSNGYTVQPLPDGDMIVTIRHDGAKGVVVRGQDPQVQTGADKLALVGDWSPSIRETKDTPEMSAATKGAILKQYFNGNQVRLLGQFSPEGGTADVYVDGQKQLVGIDCWSPEQRDAQILYYRNGLTDGTHELRIEVNGAKNPLSTGTKVGLTALQSSSEKPKGGYQREEAPTAPQRMILGYTSRTDYTDTAGNTWRPCTEWIVRTGNGTDPVISNWWTQPRRLGIANTLDPELYRFGAHASEFWVNVTAKPGTYYVRIKLMESRSIEPEKRALDIRINGELKSENLDIASTAGGLNSAYDLVFNKITPRNGIIEIRFSNSHGGEAICQALETGPGEGAPSSTAP